jgi:hypothetical protein
MQFVIDAASVPWRPDYLVMLAIDDVAVKAS